MTLADAINRARELVLDQEQPLLRMLARARASRSALVRAITAYRAAADMLEAQLSPGEAS